MKTEQKIIADIISLETLLFDYEAYLNETEQSSLQCLYDVLGRQLTEKEKTLIYSQRLNFMDECIGERAEEFLNKKMYYEL
jgi:hypothetical protein